MTFIILAAVLIIAAILVLKTLSGPGGPLEPPARRAGRQGEQVATNIIQSVLGEDDHLFTNVKITYEHKPAEMDNVIVNTCGVFIIEVKNYVGKLYGKEDDYEWKKYKTTDGGRIFGKKVKNPIKQVKRQTYLLSGYLEKHGCRVWVDGRAMLLHGNSPVNSPYILTDMKEIERTVHTPGKNRLNEKTVNKICKLLSACK